MCYKIIESLKCSFCKERAIVYKACVDDSGRARDCDEYFVIGGMDNDETHEVIFTKTDDATEITFVCGWCAVFIGLDIVDEWNEAPGVRSEILEDSRKLTSVKDYMVHKLLEVKPGEDAGTCGYRNRDGDIVVIFCTYENVGEDSSVTVYSMPSKRRRYV